MLLSVKIYLCELISSKTEPVDFCEYICEFMHVYMVCFFYHLPIFLSFCLSFCPSMYLSIVYLAFLSSIYHLSAYFKYMILSIYLLSM